MYLCWQVADTKWILCCRKTDVKCAYLRFLMYKVYDTLGPYVKHDHGPIRVLKGPQGTTHSMDPERDQNLDPKSRVQKVVPE